MPHLFTSRLLKNFLLSGLSSDIKIEFKQWNNRLYLFASLLFVIGSIFFLPIFSIFGALGAKIFALGVFIFLLLNLKDFHELFQIYNKENPEISNSLEITSVSLYLLGEINYLIGTYYFIFHPINEWSAGLYFIVGSVFFTIAPIITLMLPTRNYPYHKLILMNTNTACNIVGGFLFTVGSIPYLWTRFSLNLDNLMAFQFIFGSIALLIGSILSQIHTKIKVSDFTNVKSKK